MDYQVLVGELNRTAHLHEESQLVSKRRLLRTHVPIDRDAFDILHDEVEHAVIAHTTVQHSCNVGMLQPGQYLPFLAEPFKENLGCQRQVDKFYRHLLFVLAIGPARQIHSAHTTPSKQRQYLIGTESLTRHCRLYRRL